MKPWIHLDRAGAYQSIVEQWLPDCAIVYDRFHLVMNVNQAVDEVRRSEWRAAGKSGKKVIKRTHDLASATNYRTPQELFTETPLLHFALEPRRSGFIAPVASPSLRRI